MNLFSLKVSDDYLCEGFKKNFNNIKKDNFLKKRLNNELRKLNNLFLAPTNYFFSSREKEEVNEFIQNKIKECVFYKKQNPNILVLKDLLHKHNDLKMEMKSLENEIKSLANDI